MKHTLLKMLPFVELKQVYDTITRAIGKGHEPKAELLTVARFLNDMCAHDGIALEPREEDPDKEAEGKDSETTVDPKQPFNKAQLRFILEDLSPGLVKRMCRERSSDVQVSPAESISIFARSYNENRS